MASSSAVETTLSASLMMAPRVSTSCGNVTGGDVCRMIRQCPHPSPNRVLAGAGVGRGSAQKLMRGSSSRGQILVEMLTKTASGRGQVLAEKFAGAKVGRGQSTPLPPVRRPEEKGGHASTHTGASLPPPITMHLNHQGPPVTYSEAASRPPQRATISPGELVMCNVRVKIAAHKKEKEATPSYLQPDPEVGMGQTSHPKEGEGA